MIITAAGGLGVSGELDPTGAGFSLLAALCFALYAVLGKKVLSRNAPLIVTTLSLFSGLILLSTLTASTVGMEGLLHASETTWRIMVPLGVAYIGIAYPLWYTSLKRLPATHISVYIYMTPVFAVVLSLIILKEKLFLNFWLGGFLVLSGIVVSNLSASRRGREAAGSEKA